MQVWLATEHFALLKHPGQTIQTQERELRRLRAALRAVTAEPTAQSIKTEDEDVSMDGGGPAPVPAPSNGTEIEEEAEDDDEDEDIEPVWGEDDAMYFCGICGWEIAEALCQNCCQRYDVRRLAGLLWMSWQSDVCVGL